VLHQQKFYRDITMLTSREDKQAKCCSETYFKITDIYLPLTVAALLSRPILVSTSDANTDDGNCIFVSWN